MTKLLEVGVTNNQNGVMIQSSAVINTKALKEHGTDVKVKSLFLFLLFDSEDHFHSCSMV